MKTALAPQVPRNASATFPVDGHVHLHGRDLAARTLDAALGNFRLVTRQPPQGLQGALLLAQSSSERIFEELEAQRREGVWSIRPARFEAETLIARKDGCELAIVCGRQIQTREGLEVLALGTRRRFPDGLELIEVLRYVNESGALSVLPWGFGKWLGRRGSLIDSILQASDGRQIFVGDNGGRFDATVPEPIRRCEREGFRILPGTDPFPFGRDFKRVGTFGFLTEPPGDAEAPWSFLRDWLRNRRESPEQFGRACGAARFVFNQLGIQIHKRYFRHAST